jgi:hypothetical protein
MTSTPIADATATAVPSREASHIEPEDRHNIDLADSASAMRDRERTANYHRRQSGLPPYEQQLMPGMAASHDAVLQLVNAQHVLIQAQHKALHDANITDLASAQHGFIVAQAGVLEKLGVFGTP